MSPPYPTRPDERDQWIRNHRTGISRTPLSSRRAAAWIAEMEPDANRVLQAGLTLFLTNRECPWRCLMCDLWRHTLTERVRPGDVPFQIETALYEAGAARSSARWIKLYNAGSFFDAGAIPPVDHPAIAVQMTGFDRVVLENHPALTDRRILPFRNDLGPVKLELAMGLETAHPSVLERLNKGIDLNQFRRAADFLRDHQIALRVFVLIRPPFLNESEALYWACRSIDFAFDCGAAVVSLIPTRLGNGALEALAAHGQFSPPELGTAEAVFRYGLKQGRGRVFLDLWDLEKSVSDPASIPERRSLLEEANQKQCFSDGRETGL